MINFSIRNITFLAIVYSFFMLQGCSLSDEKISPWEPVEAKGEPTARHEAGLVAYKDKLYLIGGRRINPTDEFNTSSNTWVAKSPTPIELHHFQPVVVGDAIYLMGAMTGQWPNEKPVERIIKYYPERDEYQYGDSIPTHRRRGGAGVVYHNEKLYMVGGITKGHMNGYQPWFDEYDPTTGRWVTLPDAPNARDHFQAAIIANKLYAFAGRTTSRITNEDMKLTVAHGNVFNFETKQWEPVTENLSIPTMRAGNAVFVHGNEVIIGGGESEAHEVAHNEVEAFNVVSGTWRNWTPLLEGRHGTGFAIVGDYVYTASGSGNRGGGPELTTVERLKLPGKAGMSKSIGKVANNVYKQWHTVTLSFNGPETAENAANNPFLNYRLTVNFTHQDTSYTIRGFYAADGNAAESSADKGQVWHAKFTPDRPGKWTYQANMQEGENIALNEDLSVGAPTEISNAAGSFVVTRTDKEFPDFRSGGRIEIANAYYRLSGTKAYWLKGGADSPENLLAYQDFDGTYRIQASNDDGEAKTTDQIHRFNPHFSDWHSGDPVWQDSKGKSIIGAMNYLSNKGMNAVYFLTMNILGDGKDVWPYVSHEDFTRFDVSKLAQWEILFQHMQSKGLLLHVVLQETENELLLDNGDTGPMRQLYLRELIARFGHHLALKWNLGEENGPAHWSPEGQTDKQRRSMTSFIKQHDPYNHPVVLHTHSTDPERGEVLKQIVGFKDLDGLSLQQNIREQAAAVLQQLKTESKAAGHEWIITMDEIGQWHTGAQTDSLDPYHESLRQYVLWGTLLSGAAGVEWYFGARPPHNDLTSEDWRQRDQLWQITNNALQFFGQHLPYWEMTPSHELVSGKGAYCMMKEDEIYAVYLPSSGRYSIDLSKATGDFVVSWYDPVKGGELLQGDVVTIQGGGKRNLGAAPQVEREAKNNDWVLLIKKS